MKRSCLAALLAFAACSPETTSFRTTDTADPARPAAAMQVVDRGIRVDAWSNGGYIGTSDEPMTHVGFEVRNASATPVIFDSDTLQLAVFDKHGAVLPPTKFVTVTPLGPAKITVAPGETKAFDSYFAIPVSPRTVETMRVRWMLRLGDRRIPQASTFVRDDDYLVSEPPSSPTT
ncbi:MAG TPA: hypothetical protein VLT45_18205 [Kofleriaceae bacterium]|nr:hypothetical protein [Kofleriaceae bacterium]